MDVLNETWAGRSRQFAALSGPDFLTRWKTLQASSPQWSDEALRLRYRHQVGEFLRYTLPEVFKFDWNAYHRAVLSIEKNHWSEQTEVERRLNLAPRGVGKSTLKKGDVAHSIVYGLRRFIVVVATNQKESQGWAAALQMWFGERNADNARLHDLYGPFTISGPADKFTIETRWGTKTTIQCSSTSTSLQGANEKTHRPDEVVLDDWEDRKHVRSATQRAQWQVKLNSEILKLRDRARGAVFEANVTVNHPDSISQRIREGKDPNAGWDVREFPALFSWPDRMDLWDRAKTIYLNLSLGKLRKKAARAFYEANRKLMDAGAKVLDAAAQPLYALFEMIWCEGLGAFLQEMLHKVRGLGDQIFDSTRFTRCVVEHHPVHGIRIHNGATKEVIPLHEMRRRVARWDPSTGSKGGDYASIAVILRDKDGYAYCVDCWLKQGVPVSGQLEAAWALAEKWGLSAISLESNGFQAVIDEVFRPQRAARKELGKFHKLTLELDPSTGNKEDRLSGLEPALHSPILQIAQHVTPVLIQQIEDFDGIANSHKDDGHDALEGAFARSGGLPPQMRDHTLSKQAA